MLVSRSLDFPFLIYSTGHSFISPLNAITGEKIPPKTLWAYFQKHNYVVYCPCLLISSGVAQERKCILSLSKKKCVKTGYVKVISSCGPCGFQSRQLYSYSGLFLYSPNLIVFLEYSFPTGQVHCESLQ